MRFTGPSAFAGVTPAPQSPQRTLEINVVSSPDCQAEAQAGATDSHDRVRKLSAFTHESCARSVDHNRATEHVAARVQCAAPKVVVDDCEVRIFIESLYAVKFRPCARRNPSTSKKFEVTRAAGTV